VLWAAGVEWSAMVKRPLCIYCCVFSWMFFIASRA